MLFQISRSRRTLVAAVLLAFALVATACGGSETATAGQDRIDDLQAQVDELTEAANASVAVEEPVSTTTTAAPTTTTTIDPCPAPASSASVAPFVPEEVAPAELLTSITAGLVDGSGSITVGVGNRDDTMSAFESLLIDEVVSRMFGEVTIERVPLGPADRLDQLRNVHMMFSNTLPSVSRSERGLFTRPYMVEGLTLISRAGEAYDLTCFAGSLGVLAGTTTASDGQALLTDTSSEGFTVVEAATQDELLGLLTSGEADLVTAFPVLYLNDVERYDVAASGLLQPISAWVFDDSVFRDELDAELARIVADGTWEALYVEAFGEAPYFPIADMRSAPIPDW